MRIGVEEPVSEMSPSTPYVLLPQHSTVPSDRTAQLVASEAETAVAVGALGGAPKGAITEIGVNDGLEVPLPSSSSLLSPQHWTVPPSSSAQVEKYPTETAVAPDI